MTLALKQLVQVDISGKYLWSTNKTGAYNVDTNPGGFGAPNPELSYSALLVLARRKTTYLTYVSAMIMYNAAAVNTSEDQWQLNYPDMDGVIDVYLMRLWVSADGIIDTSGDHAIADGDYFFIPGQADKVWLKNGSGPDAVEEVTDFDQLIESDEVDNPYQVQCQDIFYNKIAKYKDRLYRDKVAARSKDDTKVVEELRLEITDIDQDVQSADYAFRSGLVTKANDIIESVVDRYSIT